MKRLIDDDNHRLGKVVSVIFHEGSISRGQTPPIDRPWCYHTGASLNGKPD